MDFSLDSLFSVGSLIGNGSYVLLILSMAMRDMFWLRCLAILSGITGITYDAIWLHDPVGTFWESCFTLTNLGQWIWLIKEGRLRRLSKDERVLKDKYFYGIPDLEFKQLLKGTVQEHGEVGQLLTEQGRAVSRLLMLIEGEVDVVIDGNVVSKCVPGDFVGEISFLTGKPATALTVVSKLALFLVFDHKQLATLSKKSDLLGLTINALLSKNLAAKLIKMNKK